MRYGVSAPTNAAIKKNNSRGVNMELETTTVILILVGLLQAYFWFDKDRDSKERKEMRASIKAMEAVLSRIEKDLAVARYALFRQTKDEIDE